MRIMVKVFAWRCGLGCFHVGAGEPSTRGPYTQVVRPAVAGALPRVAITGVLR